MSEKLKSTQLAAYRKKAAEAQGNRCDLCGKPFTAKPPYDPVLDHCHRTGAVRGVIHRGCNSLYGKLENGAPRFGVHDLPSFTNGCAQYQRKHMTNITGLTHPLHKTAEEKKIATAAKRKKAAAKKRAQTALL